MKLFFIKAFSVLCFFMLTGCSGITESDLATASQIIDAKTGINISYKPSGEKIRFAFVDIQDNPKSGKALYYLTEELRRLSLIELEGVLPFDPENVTTKELIYYLAENDLGKHIDIAGESVYFLSSANYDNIKETLQRQAQNKEIDFIVCLETSAGILAKEIKQIPVILFNGIDPVGSGFSLSPNDSGQDNLWADINDPMYKNQFQFYFDNFKFQNPGLIYSDEESSALSAYREVARKNGISLRGLKLTAEANYSPGGAVAYYSALDSACKKLIDVDKIDAFFIMADVFKDEGLMNKYYDMFYKAGIPVFVQEGDAFVKNGALMYISGNSVKERACFTADTILKILQGNLPRSLKQEHISAAYLSINLAAANKLNYTLNPQLILAADKIYESYSGIH